jgi:hypothetical protein
MKKARRFVIAGDNHGDMIDPVAERAFFSFLKDFKPQIRVHSGDNWDFRNIRRGASDEEKAHSLEDDWVAGSDFMRRFFDGGQEIYYLRGNHCQRMWTSAESSTGLIRDYATDGIKRIESLVKRAGSKMLPYDSRLGVLDIGHVRVIHGYAHGIGAATRHARIYRNCFYGHTHDMAVAPVEDVNGPAEARGIGCLCQIDMGYNATQTNKLRHCNGWVYGLLFDDGTYQAFQAKRIGDKFYVAENIREV